MIPFIPITNNVNSDRKYFVDGKYFLKADSNIERGRHEAQMLLIMSDSGITPQYFGAFEKDGYHWIRMERIEGETLENLKSTVSYEKKVFIVAAVLKLASDLLCCGIVHGDLNESNILYNASTRKAYLIDLECARAERSLYDVYCGPWGLMDLLEKLR